MICEKREQLACEWMETKRRAARDATGQDLLVTAAKDGDKNWEVWILEHTNDWRLFNVVAYGIDQSADFAFSDALDEYVGELNDAAEHQADLAREARRPPA
jgi:hypothetical protein